MLATQSRHNTFNVASGVLSYAEDMGYIHTNPARKVRKRLPSREPALAAAKKRVRFLTQQEVNGLADAAREEAIAAAQRKRVRVDALRADGDALMVQFMAWSGLRRGEVAGFQVRDLNAKRSTVEVERTVTRIKGELVIGPPKRDSTRTVPLPPTLAGRLADFIAARNLQPSDFVFGGSTPRDMESFYRGRFRLACQRAELGHVRIYDLRHTFASLMAHQGYKVHEVSEWLGHSKPSVTLDVYTHLFKDEQHHAARAAALDAAFTAVPPTRALRVAK